MEIIVDNKEQSNIGHITVLNIIEKYTGKGSLDIVTGYFSVEGMKHLKDAVANKITKYRIVLGDITNAEKDLENPLDLLNLNTSIERAFEISKDAREIVDFLRSGNMDIHTVEPNFCHAKVMVHKVDDDSGAEFPDSRSYMISGSSNITTSGLGAGQKEHNNIELNIVHTKEPNGAIDFITPMSNWFDTLWKSSKGDKSISGESKKMNFKEYLIDVISRIFKEYEPKDIIYKMLFEMHYKNSNSDKIKENVETALENTAIYQSLYSFQEDVVKRLIYLLESYNGAVLADAVGLGKTWSALAVIKYYQKKRDVLVLCPKKLEQNWLKFRKDQNSRFESDSLNYFIRFHSDLREQTFSKDEYAREVGNDNINFTEKPLLIVIDESHNLRNEKSKRYEFLLNNIIKQNNDVKVLMLSATPVNNSFKDLKAQIKLIAKDRPDAFKESMDISNFEAEFDRATKEYEDWFKRKNSDNDAKATIDSLMASEEMKGFLKLSNTLVVARTRAMINKHYEQNLVFPSKEKPENIYKTANILKIKGDDAFSELIDKLPEHLTAYMYSQYYDIAQDEEIKDGQLVEIMKFFLLKRLESCWYSFYKTLSKIREYHGSMLKYAEVYNNNQGNSTILLKDGTDHDEDSESIEYEIPTDYVVDFSKIKKDNKESRFTNFLNDLKRDVDILDALLKDTKAFAGIDEKGDTFDITSKFDSDDKLNVLIDKVIDKKKNKKNKKILIFTSYKDTAEYLFHQLKAHGYNKLAFVSGTEVGVSEEIDDPRKRSNKIDFILERFAPKSKLMNEIKWERFRVEERCGNYEQWKQMINSSDNDGKKYESAKTALENEIDILIATDVLSEGQNLQDADTVVNYDVHWNPVRLIQRFGRIDRIGSDNEKIKSITFWPVQQVEDYIELQTRVKKKMIQGRAVGAETHQLNDDEDKESKELENKQIEMMENIKQYGDIKLSDEKVEVMNKLLPLLQKFDKDSTEKYQNLPQGIYSGFIGENEDFPKEGIIALLGFNKIMGSKRDYKEYKLIYIDSDGEPVMKSETSILEALGKHTDAKRAGLEKIEDFSDEELLKQELQKLKKALMNYSNTLELEIEREDESKERNGMEVNRKESRKRAKMENYDLLAWLLISAK